MMVTVTEAAKLLSLSPKRVYRLIADGRIRKREQFGRVLISEAELKRFQKLPRANGRPRSNGHRTKSPRRTLCESCGAEVTSADRSMGACSQCGHSLKG